METGGLCLLFEVRSPKLKSQPGDICFPGGRSGGESPQECALRETQEENRHTCLTSEDPLTVLTHYTVFGYTPHTFPASTDEGDLKAQVINQDEAQELLRYPWTSSVENEAVI